MNEGTVRLVRNLIAIMVCLSIFRCGDPNLRKHTIPSVNGDPDVPAPVDTSSISFTLGIASAGLNGLLMVDEGFIEPRQDIDSIQAYLVQGNRQDIRSFFVRICGTGKIVSFNSGGLASIRVERLIAIDLSEQSGLELALENEAVKIRFDHAHILPDGKYLVRIDIVDRLGQHHIFKKNYGRLRGDISPVSERGGDGMVMTDDWTFYHIFSELPFDGQEPLHVRADLNGDRMIDDNDLQIINAQFQKSILDLEYPNECE